MLLKNPSQIGDLGFGRVLSLQARHGALIMHMPVHHTLGGRASCAVMLCVHCGIGSRLRAVAQVDKHRSAAQNEGQCSHDQGFSHSKISFKPMLNCLKITSLAH